MELNQPQPNMEKPQIPGLHDEIADLEKKLAGKRRLAEISGIELPAEKEIFKEVVKEHIQEKKAEVSAALPQAGQQIQQQQAQSEADRLKEMAEQKQFEELVNIALSKSPIDAVHIAENMHNPKLLDDLHAYLTDQLYNALVERRELREL